MLSGKLKMEIEYKKVQGFVKVKVKYDTGASFIACTYTVDSKTGKRDSNDPKKKARFATKKKIQVRYHKRQKKNHCQGAMWEAHALYHSSALHSCSCAMLYRISHVVLLPRVFLLCLCLLFSRSFSLSPIRARTAGTGRQEEAEKGQKGKKEL